MKIAVASNGPHWSSDVADVFGRSPYFLVFDEEAGSAQVVANPGAGITSGSGVGAAQLLLDHGVDLLAAPKVGPQAHKVLSEGGVRFCFCKGMQARAALKEARREETV